MLDEDENDADIETSRYTDAGRKNSLGSGSPGWTAGHGIVLISASGELGAE